MTLDVVRKHLTVSQHAKWLYAQLLLPGYTQSFRRTNILRTLSKAEKLGML